MSELVRKMTEEEKKRMDDWAKKACQQRDHKTLTRGLDIKRYGRYKYHK